MTRRAALSAIAEINPKVPAGIRNGVGARLVPFLPMTAVSEDGHASYQERRPVGELLKGYTYFERGDILLAKITPCLENGKAALLTDLPDELGFGSTEFHVVRPGPDVVPRYLFYAIWNRVFRRAAAGTFTGSAGQKRLPASFFDGYQIPFPPIVEQLRVATVLDIADAIRRKYRDRLRLLDRFLHSAFLELFGDPVRNQKGWPVAQLASLGEVQGGLQVSQARAAHLLSVPYLRVANVYLDRLDLSEVKQLGLTVGELGRTRLAKGDILLVEGHGNRQEIGRCAVWDGSIDPCTHQNHLIRLRLDRHVTEPSYLSAFLNSNGGRRQLMRLGKTTSGLNTISTSNVKQVEVLLPPLDLQRRYVDLRAQVVITRERLEGAQTGADRLFDSLTRSVFSNETSALEQESWIRLDVAAKGI